MDILFTGATGVVGRLAVPLLVADGHTVRAVCRSGEGCDWAGSVGAEPLQLDLFDSSAVEAAVSGVDAIVHFATAIPPLGDMRKRTAWMANDQLRTVATGNLVDAAIRSGVERFIQESITFFYADSGEEWIDEDNSIEPSWDTLDSAIVAEKHVTRFSAAGRSGTVLRLSSLYGPGRASAEYLAAVAARQLPVIGSGDNYISSLHVFDAATALSAAIHSPPGVYNVTDDRPVMSGDSLNALANKLEVTEPRRIPRWVARLALGGAASLLGNSHRVSNRRFKAISGWAPRYESVLTGWDNVVAAHEAAA